MNPVTYLKATLSELKLVRWPSVQTTVNLTGVVLGLSVLVGVYIGLLDYSFTNLLSIILK